MDATQLRASFPVLAERAYLNAGTCGPLPAASTAVSAAIADIAMAKGRTMDYFQHTRDGLAALRSAYAGVLAVTDDDVAITTSTSEGMVRVLAGLDLREGDEVLTSQTEHPGLLGPLSAVRRRGVTVRTAPLADLADAVGPQTKLVACSHVDWTTGALAPPELAQLDIPVLLDGAQGAGAVAIDLDALGCAFYAAAGQKWMCGPVGTGMLYVAPAWREQLVAFAPTYLNLENPGDGLDAHAKATAAAHDSFSLPPESLAAALAAHDVLAAFGWPAVYERARTLAALLAQRLAGAGYVVAPRGETTLVSWEMDDNADVPPRLAEQGVNVRHLPATRYIRASVGAWNDESDLDRLLGALQNAP
jgi:selenocysteine lyase/cysteine desulfurase